MPRNQLYRPAALHAHRIKWLGDITLVRPLSFSVFCGIAVAMAAIVVAFLVFGAYTKRATVTGQLVPDTGLVKVYSPQPGIVLHKRIAEGQFVLQGDILYVLSSERHSSTQGGIQSAISQQVQARQLSLHDELNKTQRLQQDEHTALTKKVAGLQSELLKIQSQIDGQQSRLKLADQAVARSQELLAQHYISTEQLQQKQADLLDQRNRLQSLERDHMAFARELTSQQIELTNLPLRHENQRAHIERMLTGAEEELIESEAKRQIVIKAPETGIATAVAVEAGQAADTGKALVSIVPMRSTLQAHLYAPSKAIGFVKPGDTVLLRYQAYPYQKFGHAKGQVASVSRTALPLGELNSAAGLANGAASYNEPLYRITVILASQAVHAYGKPQALQAGMLLEADVLQETRRLYEWVLEPLYSLTGKL